ncbi:MAG: serine hydrolase [Elusimicrobia bacterium]|nr:serine hydrolase [Elusimicrobiota bacterium]
MKRKTPARILVSLAAALLCGCGAPGKAVRKDVRESALDSLVQKKWKDYAKGKPGFKGEMSVFLRTPKGEHFGSTARQAGPGTHFRGASTTKTFTAAAIMLLHQQGKLNIDDKITALIPGQDRAYVSDTEDFAIPYKNQITIRLLLDHRAGVWDVDNSTFPATTRPPYPGQSYIMMVQEEDPDHDWIAGEQAVAVAEHKLSSFPPGADYHYSDTGYTILAQIVERVSRRRFDQFLRESFTVPNGLTETTFPYLGRDQKIPEPFLPGYSRMPAGVLESTEDNMSSHVGEGNVITTPADLSKWVRLLVRGEAGLKPETVKMMTDVLPNKDGNYGLGLSLVPGAGYGHGGAHPGYLTMARYDPGSDVSAVVSCTMMDYVTTKDEMALLYDVIRDGRRLVGFPEAVQKE